MHPASLYHVSCIPFIPVSCIVYIVSCTLYPCNLVFQKLCIPVFVYPCITCIILFLDSCICYTVYSSIPLSCVLNPRTHVSRVLSCPVNPVSCNSLFLILNQSILQYPISMYTFIPKSLYPYCVYCNPDPCIPVSCILYPCNPGVYGNYREGCLNLCFVILNIFHSTFAL